jgi:N-acetylmuramoyl-L-alanine amidase
MTVLLAFAALVAAAGTAAGQVTAAPTARWLYEEAFAREHVLRGDLSAGGGAALAPQLRDVVSAYEDVVRRFPTSGYCDNALWQAAGLARDAVQRWNQDRDRRTLARLLKWLASEYPASPFVAQARSELSRLEAAAPAPAPPPRAPSSAPAGRAAESPSATKPPAPQSVPGGAAELRSVRRTVLPEVVRVTIEFDREVAYATERLDGPARVLFDFAGSRLSPSTAEGTLTYPDDVVRQIRVGVRPDQTTRVVIDLAGVSGYSVFEMYGPYRLVVDCDREPARPVPGAQPAAAPARAAARAALMSASWGPKYQNLAGPLAPTSLPHDLDRGVEPPVARNPAPNPPVRPPDSAPPAGRTAEKPEAPSSNLGGGMSLARQLGLGVSRIVIDPGHGGHDPGAEGTGVSEAEVVLDVALRLEKLLLGDRGTDVVLTRRTDAFVSLDERTAIANRAQADLFLSIHANANRSRAVSGVESYYLNFANSPGAASVAARENAASSMSMGNLPDMVKAIALSSKTNESRDFATMVQESMVQRLKGADASMKDLGVKQAPFVVLIGAAMPSVLVEVSFITNGQESKLLRNAAYRQRIAEALADGIRRYQKTLKTGRPAPPQ